MRPLEKVTQGKRRDAQGNKIKKKKKQKIHQKVGANASP